MSKYESPHSEPSSRYDRPLPSLPGLRTDTPKHESHVTETPISPFDEEAHQYSQPRDYQSSSYNGYSQPPDHSRNPFSDDAAIPLQTQYPKNEPNQRYYGADESYDPYRQEPRRQKERKRRRKEPFFSLKRPWFIYTLTLIQIIVFIVELIRAAILTGSPIEIHPAFNPMIGPSPYVLINMGARYVPCMRNQNKVQNAETPILWPCPNQTDSTPTCQLSELCGFSGVPNPVVDGNLNAKPAPDQWFRFIVPIFLHAGIIHISFNMLLQLLLGGDMERAIGPVRVALVYFSSGIFGFVMGGNFAASGIASTGASGSLFGIIALTLLDILYTWQTRPKPLRDLLFIILDIVICFVLGLLPGLDNFSHIGGFLMGLVLGICLLRSPAPLRKRLGSESEADKAVMGSGALASNSDPNLLFAAEARNRSSVQTTASTDAHVLTRASSATMFTSPRTFFSGRKPLWWVWWLLRVGALVGVIVAFIALIESFYTHHDTQCPSCKYLSCLPVSNWCEIGDLTFHNT